MRACDVGVLIDHLRLEPQPELHAERPYGVHKRAKPLRPDLRVHLPVAEAGVVVSSMQEPPVVEYEPLGPGLGAELGQLDEVVQVVFEVHRLPGVEHDRPRRGRMGGSASQVRMEHRRDLIEARPAGRVQPRRCVRLARSKKDLAGKEQLTTAQQPYAGEAELGKGRVVAAPRRVHRPDLAASISEARRAGREQQRGV